jgi:Na+/H+ antiporter NhaD/arsenite permease-like protein
MRRILMTVAGLAASVHPASAAALDGSTLSLFWVAPFVGLLLSIALGPLVLPKLWHHHYGKVAFAWAALTLIPLALLRGPGPALEAWLHAMLLEYLSFIVMLFSLYTVAGGILIMGNLRGSPQVNTGILGLGTVLASIVGTTGASMILIRPIIRANDQRRTNVHVVVFFIFLVSNIGGALTPLGDPPLFLGFLRGVDFFWTTRHLFLETLLISAALLAIFFVLDTWLIRREEGLPPQRDKTPERGLKLYGKANIVLLGLVILAILGAASWKPGITLRFPGGELELQNIIRDGLLLLIALVSLKITPKPVRAGNDFNWEPILEVAKLFAGIFTCMIPVLAILSAGKAGALGPLVALVTGPDGSPNNLAYFWLTGLLSAFLDNAPTYLVFFQLAGGDPATLMGPMARTLEAISIAAVFMGAMTYIGNAPNLMVSVIARDMGIKMPSFFGFMAWSFGILGPLLVIMALIKY